MAKEEIRLKRQLGLIHGIGICFGLIVGSGIYITPSGVIQNAGSSGLCLVLWAIAGILEMIGTLCMAELGTTFPKSGER
jgi:amino acid transporter